MEEDGKNASKVSHKEERKDGSGKEKKKKREERKTPCNVASYLNTRFEFCLQQLSVAV